MSDSINLDIESEFAGLTPEQQDQVMRLIQDIKRGAVKGTQGASQAPRARKSRASRVVPVGLRLRPDQTGPGGRVWSKRKDSSGQDTRVLRDRMMAGHQTNLAGWQSFAKIPSRDRCRLGSHSEGQ